MRKEKLARDYFLGVDDDLQEVMVQADSMINKPLDQRISPIRSWWPHFDKMTLGYIPGKLYVLGGRPGDGKTSAATTQTANIIRSSNQSVLYISTELTPLEIVLQVGEAFCGGIATAPKGDRLTAQEEARLREAHIEIGQAITDRRLSIVHAKKLTEKFIIDAIEHHCHILNNDLISLVIIDQVNRVERNNTWGNYAIATEGLLNSIEEAASDCHVPILLLSQLGRGRDQRDKPSMGDFKHSGGLEEYAHCAILLHRGEGMEAEIIVAKNRSGNVGAIPARFIGQSHYWEEIS